MQLTKQELIDRVEAILKDKQGEFFQSTTVTTSAAGPEHGPYALNVTIKHYATGPDDALANWMMANGATR